MANERIDRVQDDAVIDTSSTSSPSKEEQVQTLLNDLADRYRQVKRAETSFVLREHLNLYEKQIAGAYQYFREVSQEELNLTYASEWVLDNYYVIRQAIRLVREDLPEGYYQRLPKLAGSVLVDYPRIYAIARDLLSLQQLRVDPAELLVLLQQFQEQVPLTMGELWALPIFLRFGLLEGLASALGRIVRPGETPALPLPPIDADINAEDAVANAVLSLRTVSEQEWKDFFESASLVDQILRQDPAGVYARMDFKSRDMYRNALEELAFAAGLEENVVASAALALARDVARSNGHANYSLESADPNVILPERQMHVGYFLIDQGRPLLEQQIGYVPGRKDRLLSWGKANRVPLYLGSILLLAVSFIALFLLILPLSSWVQFLVALLLFAVPALTISTSLVNWAITLLLKPRVLPKLELKGAIPGPFRTLVVIPALITSPEEVDSLGQELEMHYLRNSEPGIYFGLLTDFGDADTEEMPEDEALVQRAVEMIERLNQNYRRPDGEPIFFFFHRKRLWNPLEGKWMGWERKRGKLHELNLLLRNQKNLTFSKVTGNSELFKTIRYVITLDADTILPSGAAARLIGTMAHPLNQPVFHGNTSHVVSGYTILQPRMEINPATANKNWFQKIFAGDTGLDLYSMAVSDTYNDLFGEGIFVGKGIYDVDAFERSIDNHIPENRLLSHDLLEGLLGRAGLVSDITLIENYPVHYFVSVLRNHRWIRGDWQLLPWLLLPGRFHHAPLMAIDRWKIIDNLRRSLLAPALTALFVLGLLYLPGPDWIWMFVLLFSLGVPVFTSLARGAIQIIAGEPVESTIRPIRQAFFRWVLAVVFLPYEAYISIDAILTTLYRVFISKRHLLQWTTAAHTESLFQSRYQRGIEWREMGASIAFLVMTVILIALIKPAALLTSLPILFLWAVAPLVNRWMHVPLTPKENRLSEEQERLLRITMRRTWSYFERFVGPEDHWLPPDHYQESPLGLVAHRTSPTNLGLLLTSTLAAYDLGYLDQLGLVTRLTATFDTFEQLERYRGHFLNWYDTLTLNPLTPRYVSTVDSGNLAACLIVTSQACQEMRKEPIFRWELWEGYLDTLALFDEVLAGLQHPDLLPFVQPMRENLANIHKQVLAVKDQPRQWYRLYRQITGELLKDLSNFLTRLLRAGKAYLSVESLRDLQQVINQVERHHQAVDRTIRELVPWILSMENPPALIQQNESLRKCLEALRVAVSFNPVLGKIREYAEAAAEPLGELRRMILEVEAPKEEKEAALAWLETLDTQLRSGSANASLLLSGYQRISAQSQRYVQEMDFAFLYNPQRRVFHIGYNLDASQLDQNYYDLLASEARIASVIGIAKGEIPQQHWLYLNRPITQVDGKRVLLSWSATMFEYLMPPLFLRSYQGTLLDESARGAVEHQINYGRGKGVPWGISESGFYRFDANQCYQYRAFGVPGLGFKRGLSDDLVIAPYASIMAISYNPQAVYQNLQELIRFKMMGQYGFYEAIDFTGERLLVGEDYAIVREYMSHHQGMALLAMANYFRDDVFVRRMHAEPRIRSVEMLLQEQVVLSAPLQTPVGDDVKGIQRTSQAPVELTPWSVPVQTPIPQVNLLANGTYSVLISNAGAGYSQWRDLDLTRWQPDGVLDPWGTWIYIQDLAMKEGSGGIWSVGLQPIPCSPENMQVTYFAHMAVFRRSENGIVSTMELTVPPEDAIEVRRIHLSNQSDKPRHLRLTSYGEVILTQQANDARHPAFNKLFIESEYVPELNLLLFKRRPRSGKEAPVFMGHMLVLPGGAKPDGRYETDRYRFIGRARGYQCPAALVSPDYLTGSTGATLDPIFALGQEFELPPRENAQVAFLTLAGETREEVIALARRYANWNILDRSFNQADIATQAWMGKHNFDSEALQRILQILSALLFPFKEVRANSKTIAANQLGQSGLWRFGISGDYPILLVQLNDPRHLDLVREVLEVHQYLRTHRVKFDLVIVNQQQTDYGAELNRLLYRLVTRTNSDQWLTQRGGIFILYADQMRQDEHLLLETAARVVLDGERGSLANQVSDRIPQVTHLPEFNPIRRPEGDQDLAQGLPEREELLFYNGYGGFTQDQREYVIDLAPGQWTPAPWSNVVGYPEFGFLITESGSSCTWALNSGENRLTPWFNDPVRDPTGEALYLRDEETGEVWTPTPLPAGQGMPFRVRHGAGYTVFEHHSHGLKQRLRIYASPKDPVKIILLQVENTLDRPRRITATQYVEWVLGSVRHSSQPYIIPEYDQPHECLLARNPYSMDFSQRVAFLAASNPVHGLTADRTEFLGRNGNKAFPAAFRRIGLETRITPGEDPCGALQLHIDIAPGGVEEIYFLLGQGDDRAHALELVDRYHDRERVHHTWDEVQQFWDNLLGTVQVRTPDPAVDLLLNRWLLYQALSCRIWGRTAFYQSSGAYGFRDQLQDVMAVMTVAPEIAREQILDAAGHQFEAGDVLHWWHPPAGRGVRTRFSDDLLWLPYVVSQYLQVTGDWSILDEEAPFLQGTPLKEGEEERYGEFPPTELSYPLFEHCRRAIERGFTSGPHGLPLIGTGDWNDGMNRVGIEGRGESVWLAWFLVDVLKRFAEICEERGDSGLAEVYRERADRLAQNIEENAWDGEWYRRAYYDDGAPLGSAQNEECQIDSIAQSWSIISGAGQPERSQKAMQSVLDRLVRPEDRLILLFTPPFDQTERDPGYIKGYLPGIRENGGQYTHAAIWTAWAFTLLRDGNQSGRLFSLLNPIYHADNQAKADVYRVEPYVIAADVYSVPPYVRRGGWTWYTGSSGWMYRLGLEALLGFRKSGDRLYVDPVIPKEWDGFEITYRCGEGVYRVLVRNPNHVESGIQAVRVGGASVPARAGIPAELDQEDPVIEIILGEGDSD